jgi:hypothetical protein
MIIINVEKKEEQRNYGCLKRSAFFSIERRKIFFKELLVVQNIFRKFFLTYYHACNDL